MSAAREERRRVGDLVVRLEGSGPAVLLLHGIPGQADSLREVASQVAAQGYRTVLPDLLGFGESRTRGEIHLEAQADALARTLAELRISRIHIVAHDFGVPVAVTLAARHPEIAIESIVAAATNLFPDTPIPAPLRLAKMPALRWLLWPMLGTVPGARLAFRAASGRPGVGKYDLSRRSARATFAIFCRSLAGLAEIYAPVERSAAELKAPAAVLWGTKDPFFSVETGRRTAELLQAELVLLDGVGHFVPEEAPDAVVGAFARIAQRASPEELRAR